VLAVPEVLVGYHLRRRLDLPQAHTDELAVVRRMAAEGIERCQEQLQAWNDRLLPLSMALVAAHRLQWPTIARDRE
jgi:hypothetical protein